MRLIIKSTLMTAGLITAGLVAACQAGTEAPKTTHAATTALPAFDSAKMEMVLAAQDEKTKNRYDSRRPAETLEFFGVVPGMTVAEVLPGGGYYTKILLPYLGKDGKVFGVDYSQDMWTHFGGFATP